MDWNRVATNLHQYGATPPEIVIHPEDLSQEIVDNLLVDVINRCRTIQSRSSLLAHSEFASENPGKLARLIGSACAELVSHLVRIRDKYLENPNVLNDIRIIDDFVREVGAQLRYVDGAIATKVPPSLPQPLEKLCQKLLPGTNLMLRPQWKYNYSILLHDLSVTYRNELSQILPASTVEVLFKDFPRNFHIISFPSVERRTALLHCDLAHEIGHLVAKAYLLFEGKNRPYLLELRRRVAERVELELRDRPLLIPETIQKYLEDADFVRWRGFSEIISDIFAIRLFGPAALFALFQMAIGDSLDFAPSKETSYYPPWRRRLRHALGTLESAHLLPVKIDPDSFHVIVEVQQKINQRVNAIRELTLLKNDEDAISRNWITRIAYDSIDEAIPHLETFLGDNYGDKFLTRGKLYSQIYPLVERLQLKLPPNAVESSPYHSRAADLEAIMNAAWFYRIAFLEHPFVEGQLDEKFQRDYQILNALTLKAIEYSHIQQLFNEWESSRN